MPLPQAQFDPVSLLSSRETNRAHAAATSCAMIKAGTCSGDIPANVSVNARAIVTAGLAKDVEAAMSIAPGGTDALGEALISRLRDLTDID